MMVDIKSKLILMRNAILNTLIFNYKVDGFLRLVYNFDGG